MVTDHPNQSGRKPNSVSPFFVLLLVVAGILLCCLSFSADQTVIDWVKTHDVTWARELARFLSRYGDWPQLTVLGVIVLGIARLLRNQKSSKMLICMMLSSSIAGALVNSVRLTSGRARPNFTEAVREWNGLWNGQQFLLFNNKYHSFPSGHSSAASAFFGVALFARRRYGGWAFFIAIAIGCSRIYLNVHHLSDVLFGILVGTLTAWFVWSRLGSWVKR